MAKREMMEEEDKRCESLTSMRTITGERRPNDRYDVRSWDCHAMDAHMSYGKLSNGTSVVIRPKCITILYCNFTLFIDIFHFKVLFLCCFGLFHTVCNFPVPKQQNQNSAVKSGHKVAESDQLQMR